MQAKEFIVECIRHGYDVVFELDLNHRGLETTVSVKDQRDNYVNFETFGGADAARLDVILGKAGEIFEPVFECVSSKHDFVFGSISANERVQELLSVMISNGRKVYKAAYNISGMDYRTDNRPIIGRPLAFEATIRFSPDRESGTCHIQLKEMKTLKRILDDTYEYTFKDFDEFLTNLQKEIDDETA